MKKVKKFLLILLVLVVAWPIGYYLYYKFTYPRVSPAENISFKYTDERIERGRYLTNHVYVCFECHTPRDERYFGQPLIESKMGAGGNQMSPEHHEGVFYGSNLTPYNLGNWTDGEIIRAITTGVDKNNEPLYWGMPSYKYAEIPMEDLKAIVAYLRSLKSIRKDVPDGDPDWSIWKDMRTWQEDVTPPAKRPTFASEAERGAYLAKSASCIECHTHYNKKSEKFNPNKGASGGYEFILRDRKDVVRSANITPDSLTGIGGWTKEQFVQRFKMYDTKKGKKIPAPPGSFQSPMHWTMYAGMTVEDLGAIYEYLMQLPAVEHKVNIFTPKP